MVVERRGREPMLDLALFRSPTFVGASMAAFVLSASMFAMFLYLTLYVQNILGYSALESGLRFLPVTSSPSSPRRSPASSPSGSACAGSSPAASRSSAPACC